MSLKLIFCVFMHSQAYQIATLIREYTEVLNEEAKEQIIQNGGLPQPPQPQIMPQSLQQMQLAQQMKYQQMQNNARLMNGQLPPQQQQPAAAAQQLHFRQTAQTTLVPPQPS